MKPFGRLTDVEKGRVRFNAELAWDALFAGVKWQMPDGPCWCDMERRKNWQTKIHTAQCKLARELLVKVATD